MNTILGQKIEQTQKFMENGQRIPVTRVNVSGNVVVAIKTLEKDQYFAAQLGFGQKKKATRATLGHIKAANLTVAPLILREVRLADADTDSVKVGDKVKATEVFQPGDIVNVSGTSKGKGYAGVVKRHHFKGGPRTHGQSDRERAPGSIGQTTTPGRVYRGKRMAGNMGRENVTIQNLQVVAVTDTEVFIKGLVPGNLNSIVMIEKMKEDSKFVPLHQSSQPLSQTSSDDSTIQTTDDSNSQVTPTDAAEQAEQELEKEEEEVNEAEKVEESIEKKEAE